MHAKSLPSGDFLQSAPKTSLGFRRDTTLDLKLSTSERAALLKRAIVSTDPSSYQRSELCLGETLSDTASWTMEESCGG